MQSWSTGNDLVIQHVKNRTGSVPWLLTCFLNGDCKISFKLFPIHQTVINNFLPYKPSGCRALLEGQWCSHAFISRIHYVKQGLECFPPYCTFGKPLGSFSKQKSQAWRQNFKSILNAGSQRMADALHLDAIWRDIPKFWSDWITFSNHHWCAIASVSDAVLTSQANAFKSTS